MNPDRAKAKHANDNNNNNTISEVVAPFECDIHVLYINRQIWSVIWVCDFELPLMPIDESTVCRMHSVTFNVLIFVKISNTNIHATKQTFINILVNETDNRPNCIVHKSMRLRHAHTHTHITPTPLLSQKKTNKKYSFVCKRALSTIHTCMCGYSTY